MSKVRVYDLSKILGLSNKDLVEYITERKGIPIKSHSSSISQALANEIMLEYRRIRKAEKDGTPPPVITRASLAVLERERKLSPKDYEDKVIEEQSEPAVEPETSGEVPVETAPAEVAVTEDGPADIEKVEQGKEAEPDVPQTMEAEQKPVGIVEQRAVPETRSIKRERGSQRGQFVEGASVEVKPRPSQPVISREELAVVVAPVKSDLKKKETKKGPGEGETEEARRIRLRKKKRSRRSPDEEEIVADISADLPEEVSEVSHEEDLETETTAVEVPEKVQPRPSAVVAPAKKGAHDAETQTRTKSFAYQKRSRGFRRRMTGKQPEVTKKESTIKWMELPQVIAIGDLAKKLEISAGELIKTLMGMGIMATVNQGIDFETAAPIVKKYGFRVEMEKIVEEKTEEEIEDPDMLRERPPVVTVLGHVDHGKTSLLDCIRKTNVAGGESGGITQSIGAYAVDLKDRKIVFVDTPGHEAFTAMRARGASVTDIAVLVVAADDGVMPQTLEAVNHAKAAGVPIIVAINKIDKSEANQDRVKQQLSELELIPEEWGGDTIMVPVSAKSKIGIDDLLEMILLVADVQEFKANPERKGQGIIIESSLSSSFGPIATVIVKTGTVHVGDTVIVGREFGRIKAMMNDRGDRIDEATPSMPAEIIGLSGVPEAGDILEVMDSEKEAREISEGLKQMSRIEKLHVGSKTSLEDLFKTLQEKEVMDLNLILKADVQGSLEAIRHSIGKLSHPEISINLVHGGVGGINKSDVMLANASNAIIIGFNVRPDPISRKLAEQESIEIRVYRVIYHMMEDIRAAMEGLLKPEYEENVVGSAVVRNVFKISKVGAIAGCYVNEGKIPRNATVRLIRDGVVIFEGKISSLKRFKDDVKEVDTNFECGIGLDRFNDLQVNDMIEAFVMKEVRRELSEQAING